MVKKYPVSEMRDAIVDHLLNILEGSISLRENPEKYSSDVVLNMIEKEALIIFKELRYTHIHIGNYEWTFDDEKGIFERVI